MPDRPALDNCVAVTELFAISLEPTAFACIFAAVIELPANCAVLTCASSICLVRILFCAIFVPSTALSAMLPVAIVFAAILADVTASSAISPVAIVPSCIWSVVIT